MRPQRLPSAAVSGSIPPLAEAHSSRTESGASLGSVLIPAATVVLGPDDQPPITSWRAGGTGKTQLAAAFTHALMARHEVDLVAWVPAATRESIVLGYARALGEIGQGGTDEPDAAAGRFLDWLSRTDRRWLIVLDDLNDPANADGLWPRGGSGQALVTTEQDPLLRGHDRMMVSVGAFTQREALAYLTARLRGDSYQSTGALDLAIDLECMPLNLTYAAAYLADSGLDCRQYRQALGERRQYLPTSLADSATATFATTWMLALDRAHQLPPAGLAWPALTLMALLASGGIPGTVLTSQAACAYITGRDGQGAEDKSSVRAALGNLARLGLVHIDAADPARTVRVHGLLQAMVRSVISATDLERIAALAADAVVQAWPAAAGQPAVEHALRDCAMAIQRLAERVLWEADGHPLLLLTGESLDGAGLTRSALRYWREMIETSRRTVGTVHPLTFRFRDHMAGACEAAGRIEDAIGLRERALADREAAYGLVHPEAVAARTALAADYRRAGRYIEAIRLYERTLADRERTVGPDHMETFTARGHVGYAYLAAGQPAEAIPIYTRALRDRSRILGPDDLGTLDVRAGLAAAQFMARVPREAVPLYEQVLADRERLQGSDHEDTLLALRDLALAYQSSRRHPDAIRLYERISENRERRQGLAHPDMLAATWDLALAYHVAGRGKDAQALLDQAVTGYEESLGTGHPITDSARAMRRRYAEGRFSKEPAVRIPVPLGRLVRQVEMASEHRVSGHGMARLEAARRESIAS